MKNSKYNADLSQKKFGSLIALERIPAIKSTSYDSWKCICDCGNSVIAYSYNLLHGHVHCCGPTHLDLIGKKYSNLKVIKRLENSPGNQERKWLCLCSCGKTITVSTAELNKGLAHCGCKKPQKEKPPIIKKTKFSVVSPEDYLFRMYKRKAKSRGLIFELNFEEFVNFIKSDCYYCGTPPFKIIQYEKNSSQFYNGIDRLNNFIGYTLQNSAPCCFFCNRAKSDNQLQDFISWGIKLGNNLEQKFP